MTDEERREFCKELLERLAALVQSDAEPGPSDEMYGFHGAGFDSTTPKPQSDAEPVAWLLSNRDGEHIGSTRDKVVAEHSRKGGVTVQPLYLAPPRPDTSAGLIEKVARAICLVRYNDPDRRMPICEENSDGPPIWTSYTRHARAAFEVIRPDTSAGLIEAAKEIERQACRESHFHRAEAFNEAARIIRARAADRSQK